MNEKVNEQVTNEIRDLSPAELDSVSGGDLWSDITNAVAGAYAPRCVGWAVQFCWY